MSDTDTQLISPQEVVFIDANVPDLQALLDGLATGVEAFVLDPAGDGVQQIADILAQNNLDDLSAISIVGHGASGEIVLGSSVVDESDLLNHAAALAQIGASLIPGGSLQLFACDVASGATGQQFIADLSQFAGGVSVAAATHDVGSADMGGSWTLDASTGPAPGRVTGDATGTAPPATTAPFTADTLANFQGELTAAPTVELWIPTNSDTNSIISAQDTGTGTASNTTTLYQNAGIFGTNGLVNTTQPQQVVFDTVDNLYFVLVDTGTDTEILSGRISDALAGTVSLTTVYDDNTKDPANNENADLIVEMQVDPVNHIVYFVDDTHFNTGTHEISQFNKISYSASTGAATSSVTTLASIDPLNDPAIAQNGGMTGFALDLASGHAVFGANIGGFISVTIIPATPYLYSVTGLTASSTSVTMTKLPLNIPVADGFFTQNGGFGIDDHSGSPILYFALTAGTVTNNNVQTTSSTGSGVYSYALTNNSSGTFSPLFQEAGNAFLQLRSITLDTATGKYYGAAPNFIGSPNNGVLIGNLSGGAPTQFLSISDIDKAAGQLALDNAPTLAITALSPTWTEEGASVALISSATASDSDNTSLASATVSISGGFFAGDTLTFSNNNNITGSYNSSTGRLTFSGVDSFAHYQTALQSVQYHGGENPTDFGSDNSRTLTWVVNDGLLTSAPQTSSVSVLFVNDPPTLSVAATAHYTEEGASATLSGSLSVSDPDDLNLSSATVAITGGTYANDGDLLAATTTATNITASYNSSTETLTLSGTDTLAHYQSVLDSVRFTATENPTNFGSNPIRTITWQAQDPSGTANGGVSISSVSTTTLTITNVDDPPTLSLGTTTASWTEEQASVTLSPSVSISDPDNLDLASATVSITGGAFTGDALLVAGQSSGTAIAGTNITPTFAGNGIVTFSGSDTLADYQSALELVTYNGGENPTDFGSDPTRTLTWTLNDGGGTANGGSQTTATTSTVSLTFVNDPPTLTNVATTAQYTEEQIGATTLSSALTVADPDDINLSSATVSITGGMFANDGDHLTADGISNGTFNNISVSYNSSTETLTLTGTDTLANYQFLLDHVTLGAGENPTNFGSNPTRTLTWQVQDPSGTLNGGSATSSLSTTTVTITNVNDPPTLALNATVASWTEEQALPTVLSPTLTVSDPDNLKLASATVAITGGTFSGDGDVLSATGTGTIAVSYNSSTETLTLTGSDTLADYHAVLETVTFNAGENPADFGSKATRTVTWTLNDGGASNATGTATSTISITSVNDPPTLAGVVSFIAASATSTVTLSPSVTITDPDDLDLTAVTVAITGGTFSGDGDVLSANVGGTNITASYNAATEILTLTGSDTLAHYQNVLDSITFNSTAGDPTNGGANATRTFSWVAQDPSGTLNGGSDTSAPQSETLAFDQPPTLSGVAATAQWIEGAPPTTLSNSVTISDPDGVNTELSATVAVTGGSFANDGDVLAANVAGTSITASYNAATETLTLTGSDSLANYQTVLDSVTFSSGHNPTDYGSQPTRTVTWVVADHLGAPSAPQTTTVSVTAVNDPPTLSNVATANYTEEGAAVTLAGSASVSDPDNLTLAGATVTVTGGTFAGDGDVLSAIAVGNITVSYNAATERLTLTGSDTLAHYQQVLDSVTFHAGENPTNYGSDPTRTVTWVLDDGVASNNLSTVQTSTVTITNVNDPPTLALGAASGQFTEEGAAVTLASAVSVTDPDSLTLAGATIHIASGGLSGDQLEVFDTVFSIALTGGVYTQINVTYNYNSSTQTLTLSGSDTLAKYEHVLDNILFTSGENPTNFGSDPTRTLTWVVDDGGASTNLSTTLTTTVTVTNVNDPPTLTNVASSAHYTEGGAAVTLAGNASVSDPDSLKLAGATVAVTGGTFAGDGDVLGAIAVGNITVSYNPAAEVLTLTGTDTLADYQQVLDSVVFSAGANPTNFGLNPTRTLTWVLNDGSGSNNLSTTQTTTVTVTGINHPPTLANVAPGAQFTEEGGAVTLSGGVSVSDPDNLKLASATVAVTGGAFAGDVLAASTGGTSITASYNSTTETLTLSGSDTLAHYQGVLDSVTFNAGENPTDFGSDTHRTVTWVLNDGSASSNLSTAVTTTVTVTNVNDPPTLSNVAASAAARPGQTITVSPAASVGDPDNLKLASATVAITGGTFAGDGDGLAAATAGTSILSSYNSSTETLTLTGSDTLAHYSQVLASVTFTSTAGDPTNGGADPLRTVSWVANDGAGSNNLSTPATTTIAVFNIPPAPTITAFSPDTGVQGDFITAASNLTLSGSAVPNATVEVFDGSSLIGTTATDGSGNWSLFVQGLANGTHTFTAETVYQGQISAPSTVFPVTVDPNAPDHAPVVSVSSFSVGQDLTVSVNAAANLSVTDPDGNAITQYQFWESPGSTNGGFYLINGIAQPRSHAITVNASDLAGVLFEGGAFAGSGGTDLLWVRASDGQEYGDWVSFTATTMAHALPGANQLPVVTVGNLTAGHGQSYTGTQLVTASDADGDTITKYQFWDSGRGVGSGPDPTAGYFLLNGQQEPENQAIEVTAAQLASITFQTASGSNLLWARAYDGFAYGAWQSFTVTAPVDNGPTAVVSDHTITKNASIAGTALVSASDNDGDPITTYQFWDNTPDEGSGYFVLNGVGQVGDTVIPVSAGQLASLSFQSGPGVGGAGSSDDLFVRAVDSLGIYSAWEEFHVNAPNQAPVVVGTNVNLGAAQTSVALSAMFTASDPDGDAITQYELWDSTTDPNSGYFDVNGVVGGHEQAIFVSPNDFANTAFVKGTDNTTKTEWMRAYDGNAWSDWTSMTLTESVNPPPPGDTPPTVTAPNITVSTTGQVFQASALVSASDSDGDAITRYQFWDSGGDTTPLGAIGHFVLNGEVLGENQAIDVAASRLSSLKFESGSGSALEWVRAFDGFQWSPWVSFNINEGVDTPPSVSVQNTSLAENQMVAASSLFSASVHAGATIQGYDFWQNTSSTGAQFDVNGTPVAGFNHEINVAAGQLSQVTFQSGSTPGTDTLFVRANDGVTWSSWQQFTVTTHA